MTLLPGLFGNFVGLGSALFQCFKVSHVNSLIFYIFNY
jgi:hypothetical protein